MTGPIVTAKDGTRYRTRPEPKHGGDCALGVDCPWCREVLPRVKWPFPVPGPQFLSAEYTFGPNCKPCPVQEGDVILHVFDGKWSIETLTKEPAESNGDLTAWIDWDIVYGDGPRKSQGTWLLSRKDPEADA